MDFLIEYGLFLAKVITVVIAVLLIVSGIAASTAKLRKAEKRGHIEIEKLNDHFEELRDALQEVLLPEVEYKQLLKQREKDKKNQAKQEKLAFKKHKNHKDVDSTNSKDVTNSGSDEVSTERKKRVYVFDFDGDIRASENHQMENIISAILPVASQQDEIVVRLESPGGMVHSYGLAASQLQRIRNKSIPLTVCVDKVAASGGYMMACLGNKIIAAPFAMIGSIGVLAQIPNFNRLLKKHDIDYELITAGEYKRTLTMFGENTESGRQKFTEEIQDTHDLFKQFVQQARPQLDIEKVATGEVWFGQKALSLDLIDNLQTSEEYLMDQLDAGCELYKVMYVEKRTLSEKVGLAAQTAVTGLMDKMLSRDREQFLS